MNAVVYSSIPPVTSMAAPALMSLSQTNTLKTENIAGYDNSTLKLIEQSSDPISPHNSEAPSASPSSVTSGTEEQMNKREPDSDAIKMFVGQVPKTMEESELREMFSKYGEIYQLNVLRDKATGQHRGCCFVTFYTRKSAIMAQDELHGKQTLAGMHHPIQMKPADNEKKNVEDRKLFIGMISKKLAENEIRSLFSPFGTIEDCMILRDTSGVSRGCAFVTYAARQSALNAIQQMHHSQTMEGCSSSLVVKFADTQKDKDVRTKMITTNNNILATPYTTGALPAGLSPQYIALLQQSLATSPVNGSLATSMPTNPLANIDLASLQNYHNMQNMGLLAGQNLIGLPAISGTPLTMTRTIASPTGGPALGLNTIAGLPAAPNQPAAPATSLSAGTLNSATAVFNGSGVANPVSMATHGYTGSHSLGGGHIALQTAQPHSINPTIDATLSQAYSGIAQYTASFPQAYAPAAAQTALSADSPAGKQTEGPDGANLFIYHLPQEFTDMDLLQAFLPFGNVVSSKVFIDKQTNLSKCFGFVSFDNPVSAQAAIATMNGFQVGMKRLKVQLKRPKNENKPYWYVYGDPLPAHL